MVVVKVAINDALALPVQTHNLLPPTPLDPAEICQKIADGHLWAKVNAIPPRRNSLGQYPGRHCEIKPTLSIQLMKVVALLALIALSTESDSPSN